MKIGLVGYQGAGKSSLFEWLTGETADPALSHSTQSAMATVPEPRVEALCKIYSPKKVTLAAIEVVDTPGLAHSDEGNAARLASIRDTGCLVAVVGAYQGQNPIEVFRNFDDDLLMADLNIVTNRVERLRDSVKRPRPNRDEQIKELSLLEPLLALLEQGESLRDAELSDDQRAAIRSFQLFSEKPRMVVVNVSEEQQDSPDLRKIPGVAEEHVFVISLALQRELSQMTPEERDDFCEEMEVSYVSSDHLIRTMMDVSQQMLFFTAGEKEVRTWMIRRGGTAVEAAGAIHTDLARGFIRAETMQCEDLIRLGSEREMKAQNLVRKEHKDYVIQDGDVLMIQHNS